MKHIFAISVAVLVGFLAAPGSHAEQSASPPSYAAGAPASTDPLTPEQIATDFVQMPLETQKLLMKILLSEKSGEEKQATTDELDATFATLPDDIQKSLYAKWDALSDEQRIALKKMNPTMVKALLIGAFKAEMNQNAPDAVTPVKKVIDAGKSFAEKSRAFVQKLIAH